MPRKRTCQSGLLFALLVTLLFGYVQAYGPENASEQQIALVTEVYEQLYQVRLEPLGPGRTAAEDETAVALAGGEYAFTPEPSPAPKPIGSRDLAYAAIEGMLETLDPHTHFLDEETFRYMHQEQEGEFYGIGVSFDVRDGYLTVVSPMEGTPAYRAGILPGDRIVSIDGENAVGISTAEVINKLRGGKGEPVVIGVDRPGQEGVREFTLLRERIPLNSVRYALMLAPETGYVRISTFAQSTAHELQVALESLAGQGMKNLVLDLRGNSGGLLTAAEHVSDLFLRQNEEIVCTKGRVRGSDARLVCRRDGAWSDLPLIVLVDRWSASASEIVAAAVQDHDRGILIGETTFGKGLVGSLYPLAHETALQVTTAQYFTPSGRFIQKPYDIPHRQADPGESEPRSGDGPDYATTAGRPVTGGGGITPDLLIEEPLLSPVMVRLDVEQGSFFDFALKYVDRHGKVADLGWQPEAAVVEEFAGFLAEHQDRTSAAELAENDALLRWAIRREVVSLSLGTDAGYRVRMEVSDAVKQALDIAPRIGAVLAGKPTPGQRLSAGV